MTYAVKEIFRTLQGEGAQAGRAAVFCRFAGCNLWTGREEDRSKAICNFCDTDFVGIGADGGRFDTAQQLANAVEQSWGGPAEQRFVVLTGGEPLLQVDAPLVEALHAKRFRIAIETNGTQEAPDGLDWICVSPKAGAAIKLQAGDELKFVFPQSGLDPNDFAHLDFKNFWIQPMDGPNRLANTAAAVAYCLEHPQWRLSVQAHKMIGVR